MFPLAAILGIGSKLIDKFIPDPAQAEQAKLKLLEMQQSGDLAQLAAETDLAKLQIQTNVEEAKNANIFVSGWRPAVGWCCAAAFAYSYVLLPFAQFLVFTFGTTAMAEQLALAPKLELSEMMPVLLGMLGLGSLRTVEKVKNVEGNR
jgi:Holin of 3TMs, for gene-transfer release